MTKAPTPTEMSKRQSDNTNNATTKFDLDSGCGPTKDGKKLFTLRVMSGDLYFPLGEA